MRRINRDEWTEVVRKVSRWNRQDQQALVKEFSVNGEPAETTKPARKKKSEVTPPTE